MERKSRRPGEGDGSNVLLGGEHLESIKNRSKEQFPILFKHLLHEPELAVQP